MDNSDCEKASELCDIVNKAGYKTNSIGKNDNIFTIKVSKKTDACKYNIPWKISVRCFKVSDLDDPTISVGLLDYKNKILKSNTNFYFEKTDELLTSDDLLEEIKTIIKQINDEKIKTK